MLETTTPSPNGKYVFQIAAREMRMSLWVEAPRLIEVTTERAVFDLLSTNWSLNRAQWLDGERVSIQVRRYPGDHLPGSFEVEIDCTAGVATLPGDVRVGLESLERALEELYFRSRVKPVAATAPRQGVLQKLLSPFKGTRIQG